MGLVDTITNDLADAMKARDRERVDALRMIVAALKNEQIALGHDLSDEEAVKVMYRLVKQRREAAEQYRSGGRKEQADKEEAEAKLLESYLPRQMSDDELRAIINDVVTQTGFGAADFGKVMGAVMARVRGSAEGARVATMVRAALKQ